jgi:hypothetical protein
VVTTLGYDLSSAILGAGTPPAWQIESAHPVGNLGTAQQRMEGAARLASTVAATSSTFGK